MADAPRGRRIEEPERRATSARLASSWQRLSIGVTSYVQAFFTVLSLVNPLICIGIFSGATRGMSKSRRISSANKACLAVAVILVGAALIGKPVLEAFGVSMAAFSVAGGLVLGAIGGIMLVGRSLAGHSSDDDVPNGGANVGNAIQPLVLFAASPGTITGVITISAAHPEGAIPATSLAAVAATVAITWLGLLLTSRKSDDEKSPGLASQIGSRLMGIIVLAMGFEFALTGIEEFFTATGKA